MSQRVLVTAAASGIGREIVRAFYQGGAAVFVCDVDTSALSELERELPGVRTATCDVGNRADIERMMVAGVAALAVFLASDSAKAISGQVLPIDNDRQQAS